MLVSTVIRRKLVIFLIGSKTASVSAVATLPHYQVTVNTMHTILRPVKEARGANIVRARNILNIHPVSKRLKVE